MIPARHRFRSDVQFIGQLPSFDEEALRVEPLLQWCSVAHARHHGGPVMQAFLRAMPADWIADETIALRVHGAQLRVGWSKGHVGWHIDGTSRRADGSADLAGGRSPSFARLCAHVGDVAPTAVLVGDVDLPAYPEGQRANVLWNRHLDAAVAAGTLSLVSPASGQLFILDSSTWHSATAAVLPGYRLFVDANRGEFSGRPKLTSTVYEESGNDFQPRTTAERFLYSPYAEPGDE